MTDLFLELFSEEIPARFQSSAQENLKSNVYRELIREKLQFDTLESFSTPRRLVLAVKGLSENIGTTTAVKRGPNVSAPDKAIEGFCKSLKIDRSQLFTKEEKKGLFYYANLKTSDKLLSDLILEILTRVINSFPWPKSMRWGSGNFRWVRPLRSIICILHSDTSTNIVPLKFDEVSANNFSVGHRFLSPEKFHVSSFEDYQTKIKQRNVILDRSFRKEKIWNDALTAAFAVNRELVEDDDLLEEVTGLVEWPVILLGKIDQKFLTLPSEVLKVSMREHQKFFSLKNKETDIIDSFITVANISTKDDGKETLSGYEHVLSARLSDAKFFLENDIRKIELEGYLSFANKLKKVTFHNQLGNLFERVERIGDIAKKIAGLLNVDLESTSVAVSLCKLDLVSEIVYEFPELQGIIGQYYAKKAHYDMSISNACYEHYLPKGAFDKVPNELISIVLALADKIDTIMSFWSVGLKPTGSKDPFALRRAAIGIIRILLENDIDLSLATLLSFGQFDFETAELLNFFNERVRVQFDGKGLNADVINSIHIGSYQNLSLKAISIRLYAIQDFVTSDAGKDLIQGYRRAINILSAEEKKDGVEYSLDPQNKLFKENVELKLYEELKKIDKKVTVDLDKNNPIRALGHLSSLKLPIDNFFNLVQINVDNSIMRRNRLCLLNQIKVVMHKVADFSKLGGDG